MKNPIRQGVLGGSLPALACFIVTLQTGCIRYVPSQEEVAKEFTANGEVVGGEKEFQAYENHLEQRLNHLIQQRAHLLTQDANEASYRIGPGDQLAFDVFGFPDMKTEVEVSPAGTITLPLVGETRIGGQSVAQARATISQVLSRYIRTPKVDLVLKGYEASRVSVVGAVAQPGMYPLKRSGLLITELLSEAGGKTDKASNRIILLPAPKVPGVRAAGLTTTAVNFTDVTAAIENDTSGIEIDLDDLVGGLNRRPRIVPLVAGDTIVVPETGTIQVDGEVTKPGSYPLSARTSAIGAVAAAGGFTYSADVNKVEVIRDLGEGKKALLTLDLEEVGLRGGKDLRLRDGDVVRVPSEPGRFFRRQIVETLNGIFNGFGVSGQVR